MHPSRTITFPSICSQFHTLVRFGKVSLYRVIRPFPLLKNYCTIMKIQRSIVTLSTSIICSAYVSRAFLPLSHRNQFVDISSPHPIDHKIKATTLTRSISSVPVEPSLSAAMKEIIIAQAVVVTQFSGGLTALRINENLSDENSPTPTTSTTFAPSPTVEFTKSPVSATTVETSPKEDTYTNNGAASGDYQGKMVVFPDGTHGVVIAHRPPLAFCYSDHEYDDSTKDGLVKILKTNASIVVNTSTIQAMDCFGKNLFPSVSAPNEDLLCRENDTRMKSRAIFSPTPGIADIALINSGMLTGTTMIDVLAPIGRGQNMLMIGHDTNQLRAVAYDFLHTQHRIGKAQCIYAACTIDPDTALQNLRQSGLAEAVHLVVGQSQHQQGKTHTNYSSDITMSQAAAAVTTASTACAIAESYALWEGKDAVVVVDTIDLHKVFWDGTTRVLVDVFGVDAVVESDRSGGASSEMRGFFSSLIQRASQYKATKGGGSVTILLLVSIPSSQVEPDTIFQPSDFAQTPDAIQTRINILVQKNIPLSAANLLKLGIPIPSAIEGQRRMVLQHIDDLMSMSDGQIWLDERLAMCGQQPPIDPQRSITRIGIGADTQSRADAPALRSIAEGIRLDLAQAMTLDGAEATMASSKQRKRQNALLLAMYQTSGSGGRRLGESCCVLLAAKEGYFDSAVDSGALAGTVEGEQLIQNLLKHVGNVASEAFNEIDETLNLTEKSRNALRDAIASFF